MSPSSSACSALGILLLAGAATAAVAARQTPPTPPQAPPPSPPPAVKVGEAAPDFTLPYLVPKAEGGFETRQVTLASFKGKQNVVLAFFPAAFSPG
jgi:hypothetical protein